jgi:hypothetical protein
MVNEILTASGVNYKKARFVAPPSGSYAVYTDDIETDGPDGINAIFKHHITVELFESQPDDAIEAAIEAALDAAGVYWEKQDRFWIQTEQRYQIIYEFDYIEKRRITT